MRKLSLVLFLVLLDLVMIQTIFGYDNEMAHPKITELAVQKSVLKTYLPQNLGPDFSKGYDSLIGIKSVIRWISEGSIAEDAQPCRRANHFHNPLKPWTESNGNDVWWQSSGCSSLGWPRLYSDVTWATGYLAPPPDGQKATFSNAPGTTPQNWDIARNEYYEALTSIYNSVRTSLFAQTFITLGQVMHLLQDMAVPAHVRNDFQSHLVGGLFSPKQPYEYYVQANAGRLISSATPIFPSFSNSILTDFWDTDKYNGSNPSTLTDIGLAEFSNANYFSDYTIPNNGTTPEHTFPYPYISSSNISSPSYQICTYQLFPGASVKYISRKDRGPCPADLAAADHFASVSLMNPSGYPDANSYEYVWLDDNVHNTYAKDLLPRAVGYSAGLLDYFFRGQMSLVPDGDSVSQVAIANNGKEDMTGTFSLYYDDKDNNRVLITSWENLAVDAESQSSTVTFNVPSNPPPKEKDKYILVFKGKMGNETGAVAGKIVKWWREEWDSERLTGNHTWLTTDSELLRQNPANGETHNDVISGKLTKENIRYAGNYATRINQTIIQDAYEQPWGGSTQYCLDEESSAYCVPFDFGTEFPMPITKDTVVRVKIDEMSINENIPYQECGPAYGGPGGYQGIILRFDNGVDFAFTVPDQVPFNMKLVSYITPGVETSFNIFDAFKNAKVEFTEPVNLVSVNISQQLWNLCAPSTTEHRQRMVVDYMRFQEQ